MTGDQRRLFLALPIDGETRRKAALFLLDAKKKFPDIHWCEPDGLHLTLHFFGITEPDRLAVIRKEAAQAAAHMPRLKLTCRSLGIFPDERHPKVIWAGVYGPLAPLAEMQERLVQRLKAAGFEGDPRPFKPHVTLGRIRKKPAEDLTQTLVFPECPALLISVMALYESRSSNHGARYEILETFDLAEAPKI